MLSLKNILTLTVAVAGLVFAPSVTMAAPLKNGQLSKRTDPTISASQISTLKTYATLSSIAYCVVEGWSCGPYCAAFPGTTVVATFDPFIGTDQAGYVAYVPTLNEIVVSFRGTLSIQNFVDDVDFPLTNYPPVSGAQIHSGFYQNFQSVQSTILTALSQAKSKYPSASIIITGHSLGGAVAVLSALDMLQKGVITTSNAKVYTYGEPRVGNPAFANYVDSTGLSFSRTTHYNDPVPQLPPQSFGFRHHQNEYWIHSDDSTTNACVGQEDPSCSDSTASSGNLLNHLLYYEPINFCIYV